MNTFADQFEKLVIYFETKVNRKATNSEENKILLKFIRFKLGLVPDVNSFVRSEEKKNRR